jgi:hypothetical protein
MVLRDASAALPFFAADLNLLKGVRHQPTRSKIGGAHRNKWNPRLLRVCSLPRKAANGVLCRRSLTKSRKVSVKCCGQIVANRVLASVLQLDHAFAIAVFALLFDALLPFGSPAHRGRMPYWSLTATLVQRAHLGRLLGPQKHQRFALPLLVKALAQPRVQLGRFLAPPKRRRSALLLAVKSTIRWVVL